jgi:group I intron endonuclease
MILTGIYKILNKINNKVYIGSATDIRKRWRDHKWYLNHNIHHNSHLQSSWNKYGVDNFEFSIIIECRINKLLIKEKEFMLKFNSFDNNYGYNVNDPEHSFLNRKHSEKTKKILSLKKQGANNPMFGKCGIEHHNFNKPVSVETRNKISLGRKKTNTTIGENHPAAKLTSNDIIKIREMYFIEGISQKGISKIYNVAHSNINSIILRNTWAHVI